MQKECREDILICPNCGLQYSIRYKRIDYCPNCGTRIHHQNKQQDDNKEKT